MELPSWQEKVVESLSDMPPARIPLRGAWKFFAVDASASTMGKIMQAQERTVRGLHDNPDDMVVLWDSRCHCPCLLENVGPNFLFECGGTDPACILEDSSALDQIKRSDLWVLLTDGKISPRRVTQLAKYAKSLNVLQVPIIVVITGARHRRPEHSNLSVGITFFAAAQEALILFKDYHNGQLFVIDAKGAFNGLKLKELDQLSGWESLPRFADERELNKRCAELNVSVLPSSTRGTTQAISLGPEWDDITSNTLVNVPVLLDQKNLRTEDLRNLLGEEAITRLALLCKTRGELGLLRDLIIRHKRQEIIVRLEDRHGAGRIMEKLQSISAQAEDKNQLRDQLRQAHAANREAYNKRRNEPSEEQRLASELNKLINRGLQIIAGLEKSAYTADILGRKSNRAMRANLVSADDSAIHVAALDLSNDIQAFRGACSICCEDDQVMSIVLKRLAMVEENTTDFALNFPLAAAQAKQNVNMVSAQCICFQCALTMDRSIYQEHIAAIVPTLDYQGANKKYIDHQLTLAITAGLATGASGIVQLFATILDRTLETKDWCSHEHTEDGEVRSRRQVFEWMLLNLLQRCRCRENFTETGPWVAYPTALLWAIKDYQTSGLESWIIQYPLAGFSQILRWFEILHLPISAANIEAVKTAKLMHQTITVMMNGLLHEKHGGKPWRHPFLHLIYKEFNAPAVPKDMGADSLLSSGQFWNKLEDALGQWQDVNRFLTLFSTQACGAVVSRLQLVIFWALYTQQGHTTPKTFFANIASREPLAPAVLDPTAALPQGEVKTVLISIFCDKAHLRKNMTARMRDIHFGEAMPPFASPYGASVLRCGFPGCHAEFGSKDDLYNNGVEAAGHTIRTRRAKHFAEVFGIPGVFNSQTGLPEKTQAPKAPTSYHITLHISTARAWSHLEVEQKETIVSGDDLAITSFAAAVRHELCANSHRGNIYSATVDAEVRSVLPSFLEALKVASEKMGLEDRSGVAYVHDWTKNTIMGKMAYELGL
ncbi:MAG: hypothetical protein Q9209_006465 [Squamulea sp. 1 TL-2023]